MNQDPYAPPKADSRAPNGRLHLGQMSPTEFERIRRQLQTMNRNSLLLGGPGLALQTIGNVMHSGLGTAISLVGVGMLIAGLSIYARMRGHSPWLGALGLLSCIGMIILVLLPKKCFNCGAATKSATCAACGAPAPQ